MPFCPSFAQGFSLGLECSLPSYHSQNVRLMTPLDTTSSVRPFSTISSLQSWLGLFLILFTLYHPEGIQHILVSVNWKSHKQQGLITLSPQN